MKRSITSLSIAVAAVCVSAGLISSIGASASAVSLLQAPAPSSITLLLSSGRRTLATTTVNDREMVSLEDLASAFQLTLRDDSIAGAVTATYKGKEIVLTTDQGIASVAGKLVSLSGPAVRQGRRWLVPLDFITRALGPVYDSRLDYRRASRMVVVGDLRVPRIVVRHEAQGAQARLTFDASPKTSTAVVQEQGRLLVRFDADSLDASLPAALSPGLVDSIRIVDANTIAVALGPRFGSFRSSNVLADGGSTRTVVDVLPASLAPAVPSAPAGKQPQATPPAAATAPVLPAVPQAPGIHTIVIDPGHGGTEEGAHGPSGALEKDVTLGVARRLKTLIESRLGIRALLTRDADSTVALDDRAAFANNNKADIFISIHANASMRRETRGAEIFYLSPEGYEQAQQAATTSASLPAYGGGSRDIDVILWEVAQTQHLAQSASLAAIIEEELRGKVPMGAHPVQQAPFRVLVGANMPAVLLEIGFLTNAEQEQAVTGDRFQNDLAQALVGAIVRFKDTLEHR